MSDMLVKLYALPDFSSVISDLEEEGIRILRAMTPNKHQVLQFVKEHFNDCWVSECDAAFGNKPVSCFIAVNKDKEIVGFACYEATCKAFFGPTGVHEAYRGKNIGKALLLHSLYGLKEMGYAYGIIGGTEKAKGFYEKTVSATVIPESVPGIYKDMI